MQDKEKLVNYLKETTRKVLLENEITLSPYEYISYSKCIYELCTTYGFLMNTGSPFDEVSNIIIEVAKNIFIELCSSDPQQIISYLRSFVDRIKIIQHVSRFLENSQNYLMYGCRYSTITQSICYEFFKTVIIPTIKPLMLLVCQGLDSLEFYDKIDLIPIQSIFMITSFASETHNSVSFYSFIEREFLPILKNILSKYTECEIMSLPSIARTVESFLSFTSDIPSRELIRLTVFDQVIKAKIGGITQVLSKIPMNEMLCNGSQKNERLLFSALAFHYKETAQLLCNLFSDYIRNYVEKFVLESNIRNVGLSILTLFEYSDSFIQLTNAELLPSINRILKTILNETSFHQKFGSSFAIAVSFIVDAFLKRGNAFKSMIKQDHIIRLVSFIVDRDVFLKHNDYNMFFRITTRSTIGIEYEKEFVDAISAVVTDDNISHARDLLSESVENKESQFPKMSYILMRSSLIFDLPKEFCFNLPQEYHDLVKGITDSIQAKSSNKHIEWKHCLATCESKIKTSKGVSTLTMSLSQAAVVSSIVGDSKGVPVSFSNLISSTRLEDNLLLSSLKSLISPGLIEPIGDKSDLLKCHFRINDSFYAKKISFPDNWGTKIPTTPGIQLSRQIAIKSIIVKLMKASRIMRVKQLHEKVVEESSLLFPTNTETINSCIKQLIADEYLEKQDDNHLIYKE